MRLACPDFIKAFLPVALLLFLAPALAWADAPDDDGEPEAWGFLASIETSGELQTFLDETIEKLLSADSALRKQEVRVSVIDLPVSGRAQQASGTATRLSTPPA